jgi:Rrf2 family iron-sulfur cluster assembly transcriptional regulator
MTHDLWTNLNALIFNHLGAVTLKQLVDDQRVKQDGFMQMQDMRGTTPEYDHTAASV